MQVLIKVELEDGSSFTTDEIIIGLDKNSIRFKDSKTDKSTPIKLTEVFKFNIISK